MTDSNTPRRIALLVDAENMHPQYMRKVLPHVFKLGRPIIQYAFGDFSNPSAKPWAEFLKKNVIEARQVTPAESRKNSADIALVVEAMRLALTGKCDALCIVSSDRDFVPLTTFLKSEGVDVYGFGANKTDKKYRQSCAKFFEVNLDDEKGECVDVDERQQVGPELPTGSILNLPIILQEIAQLADDDGWAALQPLGITLSKRGLKSKHYGKAGWAKVFSATTLFEVRQNADNQRSVRVLREAKAA